MTNAGIASGLLLTVLACALGFRAHRIAIAGAAMAAAAAALAALVIAPVALETALLGCWSSLIVAALGVFWPRFVPASGLFVLLFSANAGVWAGLVLRSENSVASLPAVLAVLLLAWPASFCVARGWAIAPRILTSWLLAVALLAGSIPYLVEHPGYVPDHRM